MITIQDASGWDYPFSLDNGQFKIHDGDVEIRFTMAPGTLDKIAEHIHEVAKSRK